MPQNLFVQEDSGDCNWFLLGVLFACAMGAFGGDRSKLDLSGEWQVWLTNACASVVLPGTLADARLGTRWTREMFETTKDRPVPAIASCGLESSARTCWTANFCYVGALHLGMT